MSFPLNILRAFAMLLLAGAAAHAEGPPERVLVAVASNFSALCKSLGDDFTRQGHTTIEIVSASTGKLFAQVQNGAPFDVLLAADRVHPEQLIAAGHAVADTRFTYAIGRLALYSTTLPVQALGAKALQAAQVQHVAIASPETAPYGLAAAATIRALQQWDSISPRLVYGENIAQAFQFTQGGAAELGFVAYAQVINESVERFWLVPETYHAPIAQDAVLLKYGEKSKGAREFLAYLKSPEARKAIAQSGYAVPEAP